MPRFDSDPPSPNAGVRVIVHDHPARAPAWEEPEPPRPRLPDAIIVPMKHLGDERNAFIASLDAQWGGFIEKELSRRQDVAKASTPDVHQAVLIVLCHHYEKEKKAGKPLALDNVPAFLRGVIDNAVRNHARKKAARPQLELGADLDQELGAGLDPEGAALVAEQCEQLARHHAELTEEEREVFEAKELDEMTFPMIAAALQRPLSTVYGQHASALAKLRKRVRGSERAT